LATAEITKVHVIFFLISFQDGINERDIDSFKDFLKFFGDGSSKITILLSKCEELDEKGKENRIKELQGIQNIADLLVKVHPKILSIGAVSKSLYDQGDFKNYVKTLRRVRDMRKVLYDHIFDASEPLQLDKMPTFAERQEEKKLKDELAKIKRYNNEGSDRIKALEQQIQIHNDKQKGCSIQ